MREKRKRKNQILLNLPCKMITNKNYTHFMHLTKKKKAESLKKICCQIKECMSG